MKTVGRDELAKIFNVHLSTVDSWVRKGMPQKSRGSRGKKAEYVVHECIDWRIQTKGGTQADEDREPSATERKAIADAEMAELKLARETEKVCLIEDVTKTVAKEYDRVRARLLQMPGATAQRIAEECDDPTVAAVISGILLNAVQEALSDLTADDSGSRV
jgi:phage terminase Nu1 subunit (DNA packaging protein)